MVQKLGFTTINHKVEYKDIFEIWLFAGLVFVYFLPSIPNTFLDGTLLFYIRNGLFLISALFVLKDYKKIDTFIVLFFLFFATLYSLALINGNFILNQLILNVKSLIFICFFQICYKKYSWQIIKIFYMVLYFYCLLNFLLVLVFPSGLYVTNTFIDIWNGYYTYPNWLFGNKNTQSVWYLSLLLMTYFVSKRNKNDLLVLFTVFFTVLTMFLINSTTSLIVVSTASLITAFVYFFGHRIKHPLNPHLVLILFLLLELFVLFGTSSFLNDLLLNIFGKDLDFSGRASKVWPLVLEQIFNRPFIGYGQISSSAAGVILRNVALVNAHNQILQILWEGGFVLLSSAVIFFFFLAKEVNKIKCTQNKNLILLILLMFFVECLFEAVGSGFIFVIFLFLIYTSVDVSNRFLDEEQFSTMRLKRGLK